jgi:flagellar hook protein FlgE
VTKNTTQLPIYVLIAFLVNWEPITNSTKMEDVKLLSRTVMFKVESSSPVQIAINAEHAKLDILFKITSVWDQDQDANAMNNTTQTQTCVINVVQTNSLETITFLEDNKTDNAETFQWTAIFKTKSKDPDNNAINALHVELDRSFKIISVLLQDQLAYAIKSWIKITNAKTANQEN